MGVIPERRIHVVLTTALAAVTAMVCQRAPSSSSRVEGGHPDVAADSRVASAAGKLDAAHAAAVRSDGAAPHEKRVGVDEYHALFCRKKPCCVTDFWPAGQNRSGRGLTVVAVQDRRCADDDEAAADAPEPEIDPHPCVDYWLIADAGKGEKRPAKQWLDRECEGDKWEYGVEVDLGHQTFSASGRSLFSNDRTQTDLVIGLDPVRVIQTDQSSVGRSRSSDEKWNWERFAGTQELGVDYCPNKEPPDAGVEPERDAPALEMAAVIVPRVTLPGAFAAGGWRTVRLDRCAALVDGTAAGAEKGFVVFGEKGSAADSSIRLVLSAERDLYVQIEDDRLIGSAKSWVKQDHLELWIAAEPPDCVDLGAPSPAAQWGIGVPDGQVFPAFGKPATAPTVSVHRAGRTVRLKVGLGALLPEDARLTVAYSDSDDGLRQERVIATSSLSYGRWWTLGKSVEINPSQATCAVERGGLQPRIKPHRRD